MAQSVWPLKSVELAAVAEQGEALVGGGRARHEPGDGAMRPREDQVVAVAINGRCCRCRRARELRRAGRARQAGGRCRRGGRRRASEETGTIRESLLRQGQGRRRKSELFWKRGVRPESTRIVSCVFPAAQSDVDR